MSTAGAKTDNGTPSHQFGRVWPHSWSVNGWWPASVHVSQMGTNAEEKEQTILHIIPFY